MIRTRPMTRAAIAALMDGNALAAVEDLDACRCSQIDLLANEAVRYGIKEGLELDVVIRRNEGQTPLGEFVVFARQACERSTLDALKQLPATDPQPTHDVIIDAIECLANGGIGLGQREEGLVAQPPQNA